MTTFGGLSTIPVFSTPLSLAIPPWVGAVTNAGGFGWGRNGEFCVSVGLVTRADGILAEVGQRCCLLILSGYPADMSCMLASLGLTLAGSLDIGEARVSE